MLEHLRSNPVPPRRTVVLGAAGFVGGTLSRALERAGMAQRSLSSRDLDLLAEGADAKLAALLHPDDALVFVSARAPCKDNAGLIVNLRMAETLCQALEKSAVDHLVYISSDAVYSEDANPVREQSTLEPASLHGGMHQIRELMLRSTLHTPVAIVRPSLLFGVTDPHNGYGPNRFRRSAQSDARITLFGEGEEQRDHVFIDDLARLLLEVLTHRSQGVLNAATGQSLSFRAIAEKVAAGFDHPIEIRGTPRQNPITHRHFDITDLLKAFPSFRFTPIDAAIARVHKEMLAEPRT